MIHRFLSRVWCWWSPSDHAQFDKLTQLMNFTPSWFTIVATPKFFGGVGRRGRDTVSTRPFEGHQWDAGSIRLRWAMDLNISQQEDLQGRWHWKHISSQLISQQFGHGEELGCYLWVRGWCLHALKAVFTSQRCSGALVQLDMKMTTGSKGSFRLANWQDLDPSWEVPLKPPDVSHTQVSRSWDALTHTYTNRTNPWCCSVLINGVAWSWWTASSLLVHHGEELVGLSCEWVVTMRLMGFHGSLKVIDMCLDPCPRFSNHYQPSKVVRPPPGIHMVLMWKME